MERALLGDTSHAGRAVVLRISNAYGPGQRLGRGQGVIGHWMAAAARGEPLRVFGDPAATRDYVFIEDVVDAIRLLVLGTSAEVPTVLNIGSGVPTTLGELADLVSSVVGGAEIEREPGRTFDRHDTWLDVSLAKKAIGWVAGVPLIEGLRRTWAHARRTAEASGPRSSSSA